MGLLNTAPNNVKPLNDTRYVYNDGHLKVLAHR
jgi:hypothetical protein